MASTPDQNATAATMRAEVEAALQTLNLRLQDIAIRYKVTVMDLDKYLPFKLHVKRVRPPTAWNMFMATQDNDNSESAEESIQARSKRKAAAWSVMPDAEKARYEPEKQLSRDPISDAAARRQGLTSLKRLFKALELLGVSSYAILNYSSTDFPLDSDAIHVLGSHGTQWDLLLDQAHLGCRGFAHFIQGVMIDALPAHPHKTARILGGKIVKAKAQDRLRQNVNAKLLQIVKAIDPNLWRLPGELQKYFDEKGVELKVTSSNITSADVIRRSRTVGGTEILRRIDRALTQGEVQIYYKSDTVLQRGSS